MFSRNSVPPAVSSASGLDDYAILEPTADLSGLTNVYVVTEFTVSE